MQEHVPLAPLTTFRVGGPARFFVEATDEQDVGEAFQKASDEGLPLAILSGGSNLLVPDTGFDGLVLHVALRGIQQEGGCFTVAAGENWDEFVDTAVAANCAGVECLAGIPGSTGATPVQNVGAYGQEVAQTVAGVRAFDRETGRFTELAAEECGFQYRRSLFNGSARGRYIITSVRFSLRPGGRPDLAYADLKHRFQNSPELPTLAAVAAAVREIRGAKGMVLNAADPDTWSAGSYFKNPVVGAERRTEIAGRVGLSPEQMPGWPVGEGCCKLSAAWLLERAGFCRGFRLGDAGLSTKHALALTNRGRATCADILALERTIRDGVRERFGVDLEREPVLLGA